MKRICYDFAIEVHLLTTLILLFDVGNIEYQPCILDVHHPTNVTYIKCQQDIL